VCGNVLMALKVLTMAWRNDGNGSNVVNNWYCALVVLLTECVCHVLMMMMYWWWWCVCVCVVACVMYVINFIIIIIIINVCVCVWQASDIDDVWQCV
jgi:hypothetical protein